MLEPREERDIVVCGEPPGDTLLTSNRLAHAFVRVTDDIQA